MLAVLLLAMGLRFYRLDAQSFWNDEGNSARLSERSVRLIVEGTASDIHPPLYYLILRGWREFVGETEFSLRAFSAFVGVGTVALTFALAQAVGGQRSAVGIVAALVTAVNPTLIYYSQETRMYALLAFWAALSTLLLIRWRESVISNQLSVSSDQLSVTSKQLAVAYVLCAAAGLYTHYFFPAVLLAHNLTLMLWWISGKSLSRPPVRQWMVMMTAVFLLYLPWLPIFLRQTGRPGVRLPFLQFMTDSVRWLAFGNTIQPDAILWPLIAAALLVLTGAAVGGRRSAVAAIGLTVPILFMFAAGTTERPFFKFMLVSIPFWGLLVGLAFAHRASQLPALLLLLAVLWGNGRSLQNLYTNPAYARADYRGMAARIAAEDHANAGIILSAPNQWEVFTYYHREGTPVYPIPTGYPTPDNIDAELTEIAARHDRLYAIFWGELQQDPEGLVERWLDTHTFKAADEWVGDVRFVVYAVPDQPAVKMETAVSLPFGDQITLNGYTLRSDQLAAGDIVQVTLFWETAVPLDQRYKTFLHLVDANGQLVAQRDSEPRGGAPSWQPGQPAADNHGVLLPFDLPAGEYTLLLGLYDITDPTDRLPISTEAGIVDAFPLATISVSK